MKAKITVRKIQKRPGYLARLQFHFDDGSVEEQGVWTGLTEDEAVRNCVSWLGATQGTLTPEYEVVK